MARKAQTATEYLIILAVVIIIALIVVGVMGGIPGIGSSGRRTASQAYWSTAKPVALTGYSSQLVTGDMTVNVRNNEASSITMNTFNVTCAGEALALSPAGVTLNPGQATTLTGTFLTTGICSGSFSCTVAIAYTDVQTGASYTFTGDGTKLEGTCASET